MQLPSTGPLKLAIRRQRNRLKLRTISQIQICRFSITEREDSPANSQHSQVQACRQGYPPKCNFVRYLCGINIAWNPWGRKYDIVKKKRSRTASRSETPKPLGILDKKRHIFDAIFGIFHIHGYSSSLLSPTLARGFVAFPEESAIGGPGGNVEPTRSNGVDTIRSPWQCSPNPWGSPDPRHQAIARNLRVFFVSR
jgi:hypothetical protein